MSATALPAAGATSGGSARASGAQPAGDVLPWGCRSAGQIGDGQVGHRVVPTPASLPPGITVSDVYAGSSHSLFLTTEGSALAAGQNFFGQLGDGSRTDRSLATLVALPPGVRATALAAGRSFGLAATSTGSVLTWGFNEVGQLGRGPVGSDAIGLVPEPVELPLGTTVVDVAAGYAHALAITSSGAVLAWGDNSRGQLGVGTSNLAAPTPVAFPPGTVVTSVAASWFASLAVTDQGEVYQWGTDVDLPEPVPFPDGVVVEAVAVGYHHNLALTTAGAVFAWGLNRHGQLGDGTTVDRSLPAPVHLPEGVIASAIAAGSAFSVAAIVGGGHAAWGVNVSGALGDGSATDRLTPVVVGGEDIVVVSSFDHHTLALTSGGRAHTWGSNAAGQLSDPASAPLPSSSSSPVLNGVVSVAAGRDHSVAVTRDGSVLAWGSNRTGQLGDGTTIDRASPQRVNLPVGTRVVAVGAGEDHTLALTATGGLLAWGFNRRGQLGDGTTTDRATPVPVILPPGIRLTAVAAGAFHTLALTTQGRILAWGDNTYGQLAHSGDSLTPVPVSLPGSSRAVAVGAGSTHSLAATSTGSIVEWGMSTSGTAGSPTGAPRVLPLPARMAATAVAGGFDHSVASTRDGAVFAWGANYWGQLGNDTGIDSSVPQRVPLPDGVRARSISANQEHSLVVTTAGQVLQWGFISTDFTDKGILTFLYEPTPTPLPASRTVHGAAAGRCHFLAIAAVSPAADCRGERQAGFSLRNLITCLISRRLGI